MRIREPIVAGQFYPAAPKECEADVTRLLDAVPLSPSAEKHLLGGIVPHAGWTCSGAVAARVFKYLAGTRQPTTVVLLGSVHRHRGKEAAVFGDGRWDTPVGPIEMDARLAERLCGQTNLIVDDPYAHEAEHSIEVQMPFVARLFPSAKVVPIMVPPSPHAVEIGEAIGRTLMLYNYDALVVGTTDLTHYGPSYGFAPRGTGAEGQRWAKTQNDRRLIDLVLRLDGNAIVPEAAEHRNACGSGAVAATVGAVRAMGATVATLLDHTTSAEVLRETASRERADSVGYAGVVFS